MKNLLKFCYSLWTYFVFSCSCFASIIIIPNDYPTIQEGIDSSSNGDTVLVHQGTYFENINFNGKLILVCSNYVFNPSDQEIHSTIIDGSQSNSVVKFESNENLQSVLNGFKIINGQAYYGGGVFINNASPTIVNLIIENNQSTEGGGIYVSNSDALISESIVRYNSSYKGGGGFVEYSTANFAFMNFLENEATSKGGGLYCAEQADINITSALISNNYVNSVMAEGGGIYIKESSPVMLDITVTSNSVTSPTSSSTKGGGVYAYDSDFIIDNSVINSNYSSSDGGGIYLSASNPIVNNVIIDGNVADGINTKGGGGLFLKLSNPTFENLNILNNTTNSHGGGMYVGNNCNLYLSRNRILNNSSRSIGGGLYVNYSQVEFSSEERNTIYSNHQSHGTGVGNDIALLNFEGTVLLDTFSVQNPSDFYLFRGENVEIDINFGFELLLEGDLFVSTEYGSDSNPGSSDLPLRTLSSALSKIYSSSENPATIHLENGYYNSSSNTEDFPIYLFESIMLSGESSTGVIIDSESQSSVFIIQNSELNTISNVTISGGSDDRGGGILADSSNIILDNVIVQNNSAVGNFGVGGGICLLNTCVTINETDIRENTSTGNGAGIYFENSFTELIDTEVSNNSSDATGGGISSIQSTSSYESVIIFQNNAENGSGIYSESSNSSWMNSSIIENSTSSTSNYYGRGGGAYIRNSNSGFSDTNFSSNTANLGGGVYIYGSNATPQFHNVSVTQNSSNICGGGVYSDDSNFIFTNGFVSSNIVDSELESSMGGGFYIFDSSPQINNVRIHQNSSVNGGGIYLNGNSNPTISHSKVHNNYALNFGGGVFIDGLTNQIFNPVQLCSIYSNTSEYRGFGRDIYVSNTNSEVHLDTFTVQIPTDYYASPIDSIDLYINNFVDIQINDNIYVSPIIGDDENDGLSPMTPLRTISSAISKIVSNQNDNNTIYLMNGIYSPSTNGDTFPIDIFDYIVIEGESMDNVLIDAEQSGCVFKMNNVNNVVLNEITIQNGESGNGGGLNILNSNITISNVTLKNNVASDSTISGGGGFFVNNSIISIENLHCVENISNNKGGCGYIENSSVTIAESNISNNYSLNDGGGICAELSAINIFYSVVRENTSNSNGGGIANISSTLNCTFSALSDNLSNIGGGFYISGSTCSLNNLTIANNQSEYYGGVTLHSGTDLIFNNTIIWGNYPGEVAFLESWPGSNIEISYSDIGCLSSEIILYFDDTLHWNQGNINLDPQFVNQSLHDYNISASSPCIDAGDPNLLDPDLTISDIGAYFYDQTQGCDIVGDINNDSIIDILDIISIVSLILNYEYNICGDLDYNGLLNIQDIILVINIILNS